MKGTSAMKLKKLSALLLALCMVFALAACNNNEEAHPQPLPCDL